MRVLRALFGAALLCAPVIAGAIEGRVTNSVTGEPVIGATVRALDRHSYVFTASTDSSGSYRLEGLADGDYHAEISKDGFADARAPAQTLENVFGGGFVHASGDVPVRLDAQMNPWGALRGRVVDEDGKPAAGVRVEISNVLDGDTTTNADGEFSFTNLRPGSYTVAAKPKPETRMRDGERVGAVAIYYPSATQLADAGAIPVAWGADVAGIEIRLRNVAVHRVAGVVLDEAGKPAANADVKLLGPAPAARRSSFITAFSDLQPAANGFVRVNASIQGALITRAGAAPGPEAVLAQVDSKADGTFEFAAVERGDWRVIAVADEYERPRAGVVSATVGDGDADRLEIRLTAPFVVPATVDWGGDPTKGWEKVSNFVNLTPVEGQPRASIGEGDVRMPGDFGGRYRVARGFAVPNGFYIAAVMLGGADVLGRVIELAPGVGPLQAALKRDSGSVEGRVENGEGGSVFLLPKQAGETIDYFAAGVGAAGSFAFRDVPPGDYYIVAFDASNKRELPAEELPYSIASMASVVRVEAGSPAMADLRVNKWPW